MGADRRHNSRMESHAGVAAVDIDAQLSLGVSPVDLLPVFVVEDDVFTFFLAAAHFGLHCVVPHEKA